VPESVFYVATHADDALMFRGEGLFSDLHTHGVTIVHVLVSAGDAGRTDGWWEARETGCVEALAGSVTPVATPSAQVTVNGHALQRHSGPGWDCYCLRLPDGNLDGNGFDATGNRTLTKLRAGQIPSLTAIDGSTTYRGWADLVATLRAVVASQRGTTAHPWINTSDPDAALNPRDHPDHYAVAAAVQDFAAADLLNRLWWVSYDVRDRVPNLAGYALDIKWFLCRLYGWAVDDLTTTPPNDREWQWWGDRSYSRAEPA
jgi:hypothetical protein